MAAVFNMDNPLFIDGRLNVIIPYSHHGEGSQHIGEGDGMGRLLDPFYLCGDTVPDLAE